MLYFECRYEHRHFLGHELIRKRTELKALSQNLPMRLSLLVCLFGAAAFGAWACEDMSVGQALYQTARDMHALCVVANGNDPAGAEIYEALEAWLREEAEDLNVRAELIPADDQGVDWESAGLPGPPPELPAVVLVARHAPRSIAMPVERWFAAPHAG